MEAEVPSKFRGYASNDTSGKLSVFEFEPVEWQEDMVDIKVLHCGVCMSDISMARNEWGATKYPVVPGHEVIGKVVRVGSDVTKHQIGDIVGVSGHCWYCKTCPECMSGIHNCCPRAGHTMTGGGEKSFHGGFADYIRVQDYGAIPIPDGIDPRDAGPLICGGITVYNPLKLYNVKPTDKVAIIGIGGLGHLAVQICRAWGCEVTAMTTSPSKVEECKKLGAHHVIVTTDAAAVRAAKAKFNVILSTVNKPLDWDMYLSTLAPKGTFVVLGILTDPFQFSTIPVLFSQLSIAGSLMGSPSVSREMLEFCALHGIKPQCEHFKMSEWDKAFEKVDQNTIRFRGVLTPDFD